MKRVFVLSIAAVVATAQAVSGNTKHGACADLDISKRFTSNWGEVSLEQHGCSVTGRYVYQDGKLDGTLDGNMLRYKWTENDGAGRGVFVVATNGELVGTWGMGGDDTNGGGWRLVPAAGASSIAH